MENFQDINTRAEGMMGGETPNQPNPKFGRKKVLISAAVISFFAMGGFFFVVSRSNSYRLNSALKNLSPEQKEALQMLSKPDTREPFSTSTREETVQVYLDLEDSAADKTPMDAEERNQKIIEYLSTQ